MMNLNLVFMEDIMFKHKDLSVLFIIWFFMIFSIIPYGIIAFMVIQKESEVVFDANNDSYMLLLKILPVISIIIGGVSVYLRRLFLKESFYSKFFTNNNVKSIYFITILLTSALGESITIFGLILVLLGKNMTLFIVFGATASVIMLFNKPNIEEYEKFKENFESNN